MEKNSFVSLGKLRTPKTQISLYRQRNQKEETNECFKVDTGDFPTLNEFSVNSKDQTKTVVGCSKTSFSYSDKLKAAPQEHVSQSLKFSNNPNNLNKSELNYNKIQSSHAKNNLLEIKHNANNNSQTGKVKKSLQSFNSEPNQNRGFSTGRRQLSSRSEESNNLDRSSFKQIHNPQQLFNCNSNVVSDFTASAKETDIPKKPETLSVIPLSIEETIEDEGWTVYQKHTSAKKNQIQVKCREATKNSEKGFRANGRFAEQASESRYKNEKIHNSPIKNKPNFTRYNVHSNNDNDVQGASNSNFEKNNERYRFGSKVGVPYNNSNIFKRPKPNTEAPDSVSTSLHNNPPKQTTPKESGLVINNRIRTQDKNILRNDFQSSNPQSQLKSENRGPSQNNKTQPSQSKSTEEVTVESKKKRKSKVKRLAALQTGKLHILTPEAHSRILNQSSSLGKKSTSSAVTKINDEEYPELGMGVVPKNNKSYPCKHTGAVQKIGHPVLTEKYGLKFENCSEVTSQSSILDDTIEGSDTKVDIVLTDGNITNDAKLPVHTNDPITISLFDMLLTGKSKKKEMEEKIVEEDSTPENSPVKLKTNKVISQPVNPLASSKVTAKRGKEREQPKVKKPSKMRKLILMGRQMKKENMIQKDAAIEKSDVDNDILSDDSNLSPTKSPGFEDAVCGTAFYDSSNDHSNPITDTLEDKDPSISDKSCKKILFPDEGLLENEFLPESCSLSTQSSPNKFKSTNVACTEESIQSTDSNSPILLDDSASSYEDSALVQENYYKTLDKDIEISCKNCDILDNHNLVDYYETSNRELQNFSVDSQNKKTFEECKLFEESLECQLVKNHDSTLAIYCNALVQSIILDCMAEISLSSVKYFNDPRTEVSDVTSRSLSKNYQSIDYEGNIVTESSDITECQLKSIINDYCSSLIQSILDDCFSEMKSHGSKSNSSYDLTDKLTSVDENLLINNLCIEDDSNKLTLPSKTEHLEEFFKTSCNAANVAENVNILEDALEKIDNCVSSTITGDCDENISEEKLDPLSLCLENSSAVIKSEPLQSKFTDKEKTEAAKILLHTRRFRDYCTNFPTKDLEETIFNLIDDLARFQDRLHQKDPVKARVKRRLLYGIKEIKKHLKLKKLKGIIMATDIEDNKAEGGLNDLLKEVLSLSEAYHIPYVFSHKRFNLGKACRKAAPVSCVGILNYEGSEKNFKKMLELQEESKCDYIALTKKIVQELTDNHIESLFDTIQNAICPYEINKTILKELFGTDPTEECAKPEIVSTPQNSESKTERFAAKIDTQYLVSNSNGKGDNTYGSEVPVNNGCIDSENVNASDYFGTLDDLDRIKVHAILKKYSVIKT